MTSTTPSPKSINSLPAELLTKVFGGLQSSTVDLLNCMQCKKSWKLCAQATLYRHVVLTFTNVSKFTNQCPTSVHAMIHSLTLCLDYKASDAEDADITPFGGKQAAQSIWRAIDSLGLRLPNMNNLKSLSVYRRTVLDPVPLKVCWIPCSTLYNLVHNLPLTCTNLELDVNTSGFGYDTVLCSTILKILPQLEYLRLQLPIQSLEARDPPDGSCTASFDTLKDFPTATAPRLKQCIINVYYFVQRGRFIKPRRMPFSDVLGQQPYWSSWTEAFKALVDMERAPVINKLWIYNFLPALVLLGTSYSAFVRHDVLSNRSLSIPVDALDTVDGDAWVARLPGEVDTDFVTSTAGLSDVVEEHSWQQTPGGTRLPAPLMAACGLEFAARASTKEQWQQRSTSTCTAWRNEARVGGRLLDVKEGELMEELAVEEATPAGWHREQNGFVLIKDGF